MRLLVVLLACAACGPQLQTLVSKHHDREAVCAAADGSADDRTYVGRALTRDADPKLHVRVIQPEHIARALAGRGDAERIARRAHFVRVRLETNVLPVDDLDAGVAFVSNERVIGPPIDWSVLGAITDERMPPPVTDSTYLHRGTVARGVLAFFTFGMSLPFTTFSKRSYTTDAPLSVYERTAPAAYRLRIAMQGGGGCHRVPARTRGAGVSCTWYTALDPTATGPVQLDVTLAYVAKRVARSNDVCRVSHTATVRLGPLHELDARTARTFGPSMRPLRELTFER